MDVNDFLLEPRHVVEVKSGYGHTDFTIQLAHMTWTAQLISHDGNVYGIIQDEYDVPLADGHLILAWMMQQPDFLRRIWELSHEHHHGQP